MKKIPSPRAYSLLLLLMNKMPFSTPQTKQFIAKKNVSSGNAVFITSDNCCKTI
jgi:hypothetical protein